jgi:RNA polymerase sigma-70 factor, ECF subfamily
MALRTVPDTGKELRHPASGPITLTLEHQPNNAIAGELKDLSPSGFRVCLNCPALVSGQLAEIRYAQKEKKVRIVWVRKQRRRIESGLLLQEAYLLRRARGGDSQAFAELISPHVRSLRCTVCSILRNPADADEVLQESLLKVALHLDQFRAGQEFKPWFAQIATNEALKRLKKNRRHSHDPLDLGEEDEGTQGAPRCFVDPRESPADALERREFARAISTALESLDQIYRQVFVLRELRQLSAIEAAVVLGVSVDTANTRLHRARLLMRKQLLRRYPKAMFSLPRLQHS